MKIHCTFRCILIFPLDCSISSLQANKLEISLQNSSSLSNQQPAGVIVKYNDTSHKLNPMQLTHSNVEKVRFSDVIKPVHLSTSETLFFKLILTFLRIFCHANFQIHAHSIVPSQSQAKPHQVLQYKKLPEIVAAAAAAAASASAPNTAQKMPIL